LHAGFDLERSAGGYGVPLDLPGDAMEHAEHAVVAEQDVAHRRRGINRERLHLAQQEEPQGLVDFRAGQDNGCDRGIPQALPGMEAGVRLDLPAQIGGCAQ